MVKAAPPSVMSAQDGAHDLAVLLRYHASGGIAPKETGNSLPIVLTIYIALSSYFGFVIFALG